MLKFMNPILDALEDGTVIRRAASGLLRVAAAFLALGGAVAALSLFSMAISAESGSALLGGLFLCLFTIVATLCTVQVFLYRARSIEQLGPSPFTVVPVVAIGLRLTGEAVAVSVSVVGIGGCLASWLGAPLSALGSLIGLSSREAAANGFLLGVAVLGYSLMTAALWPDDGGALAREHLPGGGAARRRGGHGAEPQNARAVVRPRAAQRTSTRTGSPQGSRRGASPAAPPGGSPPPRGTPDRPSGRLAGLRRLWGAARAGQHLLCGVRRSRPERQLRTRGERWERLGVLRGSWSV